MKVLAVIVGEEDMPKSCAGCDRRKFSMFSENNWCDINYRRISKEIIRERKKPRWCPLKTAAQYEREVGK